MRDDTLALRAYGSVGGDLTKDWRARKADLRVLRDGAVVASLDRRGTENTVALGPGSYEVEARFDDGARFVVQEFSIARVLCYRKERTESEHDKVLPDGERKALLLWPHEGTRLWNKTGLSVPRVVADYEVDLQTRITWLKAGNERLTTVVGPTLAEQSIDRPEYYASSRLGERANHSNECKTLFRLDHSPIRLPDEVMREGGRWTARLVSLEAQPVEVDFDLDSNAVDERFADPPAQPYKRHPGHSSAPERRSPPLPTRAATPSPDDVAWVSERERNISLVGGSEKGQWYLADPMPITPSLFRAAYRSPEARLAFLDFAASRVATGGTIDAPGSYREGLAEGRTVAEIDASITRSQAKLDAGSSAENAARRGDLSVLGPRVRTLVKKLGAPLKPEEYPSLEPGSPAGRGE